MRGYVGPPQYSCRLVGEQDKEQGKTTPFWRCCLASVTPTGKPPPEAVAYLLELGVHVRTGYRWCWWLRNAALSYEMQRQLEGTVEADDMP